MPGSPGKPQGRGGAPQGGMGWCAACGWRAARPAELPRELGGGGGVEPPQALSKDGRDQMCGFHSFLSVEVTEAENGRGEPSWQAVAILQTGRGQ